MSDSWEDVAPLDKRELREEHEEVLVEQSGISLAIVEGRGYYSPTRIQVKGFVDYGLVHENTLKATSWISIPVYRPDGVKHAEILRLVGSEAKMKYVWPTGIRLCLDVHPDMVEYLADADVPLLFTEGVKKADALLTASMEEDTTYITVAVHGCWGWRGKTDGGSVALPDFYDIPMGKRWSFIIPDSDFRTNHNVRRGWSDCAGYVSSKTGQDKSIMVVVPSLGIEKQGADDYLVAGHTLSDLLSLGTAPDQAILDASMDAIIPLELLSGMAIIRSAVDRIPHIIEPVLPERAITVMAGQSGSLKTWHALALILDGAFGKRWIDHPDLVQGEEPWKSIYINKEMGGAIFSNRMAALSRNPRYQTVPDWETYIDANVFTPDKLAAFDLRKESSRDALEEAIQERGIRVVILDSLSMCWSGDENDNSEVGVLYSQLREITERTGVTWIIIHHTLKPSGTRKRDPLMFSIRGAGQIVQQADTAILLSPLEEPSTDPTRSEVTVAFVKTRTKKEPPTFVSRLEDHDGLYMSLSFVETVSEARAGAWVAHPKDTRKLQEWIVGEFPTMPALQPGGPGMRMPQILPLLRLQWPMGDKNPPSENTLRKALIAICETGEIDRVEENKRIGDLFRLPDLLTEGGIHIVATESPEEPKRSRGRPKTEPDRTAINEYIRIDNYKPRGRGRKK